MSAAAVIRRRTGRRVPMLEAGADVALPRAGLAAIIVLAAVLRFDDLGAVPLNPFYDAAVRSMGSSWHAFLLGAFDPNASVAIDKPPLDLWLQVASTKVFGFMSFALHLPQALMSAGAVLLLYDLVRRGFGRGAGLAAAAAFAVLPAEVLTARSDTMDAGMAALLVLAAWLVVRAAERGRGRELYLAGAVVGLAFETKLFEALVALPALVVLFLLASDAGLRVRLRRLAGAGAAMVGVGLAWPLTFALLQSRARPYPLGSSDGSIWNTVFVFNGIGRVRGSSTNSLLDRLSPAGPGRLLASGPVHFDSVLGTSLVAALAFGCAALALGLVRRRSLGRIPFAIAVAMGVWLVLAAVLLSFMSHVPVRYVEVLTPALAAVFGIGVALLMRSGRMALAVATAVTLVYAAGTTTLPAVAIVAALAASVLALVSRQRIVTALVGALVVTAVLAVPASRSQALVSANVGDAGELGAMRATTLSKVSRYLKQHQGGARYEFAALQAHVAGPLIVAGARSVLVLAGTPYHQLVTPTRLAAAARAGQVRYVLLAGAAIDHPVHASPRARTARGQLAAWVRVHGVDVSRQAGFQGYGALYRVG